MVVSAAFDEQNGQVGVGFGETTGGDARCRATPGEDNVVLTTFLVGCHGVNGSVV